MNGKPKLIIEVEEVDALYVQMRKGLRIFARNNLFLIKNKPNMQSSGKNR